MRQNLSPPHLIIGLQCEEHLAHTRIDWYGVIMDKKQLKQLRFVIPGALFYVFYLTEFHELRSFVLGQLLNSTRITCYFALK